ncbi:MAG: hypothetical protein ACE15C_02550 [Phycisphaerae bacterium]
MSAPANGCARNAAAPQAADGSILRAVLKDRPFMVAAAILLLAAVGWRTAVWGLGLALTKLPVPWPTDPMVMVDENLRNISLPLALGSYERLAEFGVIDEKKKGKTDGPPDGEEILDEETVDILVGANKDRIGERCSNWYVSRIYRKKGSQPPMTLWRLTLTYYTGGVDTVPHTFNVCGPAAGWVVESEDPFDVNTPDAPEGWRNVKFNRGVMVDPQGGRHAVYEIFTCNGRPEPSRTWVRMKQWDFTKHYGYFGKIQVSPLGLMNADTDAKAADFIRQCLPAVLKQFPTAADLDKLEAARKG